ncbi:hypothetical protein [Salinibacillus xinjiangensis]|nr:hypothetical protein [Salinibacillus xinjiangensis]
MGTACHFVASSFFGVGIGVRYVRDVEDCLFVADDLSGNAEDEWI